MSYKDFFKKVFNEKNDFNSLIPYTHVEVEGQLVDSALSFIM